MSVLYPVELEYGDAGFVEEEKRSTQKKKLGASGEPPTNSPACGNGP